MPDRTRLLAAGLLASGVALAVLILAHQLTGRPGFLDAIADGITRFVPLDAFEAGIETLGSLAKGLVYLGVAIGTLAVLAAAGALLLRATWRAGVAAVVVAGAAVSFLVAEALALPLFGAGQFGSALPGDALALHLPLAAAAIGYGLVLGGLRESWLYQAEAPPVADVAGVAATASGAATVGVAPAPGRPVAASSSMPRRTFLARGLVALGSISIIASLGVVASQVLGAAQKGAAVVRASFMPGGYGPTPALTPVDEFFSVSKSVSVPLAGVKIGAPGVEGASWQLEIAGLVDRPASYGLDQLLALPALEDSRTIECISTDIVAGDDLIGNQRWTGVRLADLLRPAGIQPAGRWVLFEALDGYTESLPIEVALHPNTWVAHGMGGSPLPSEHGYPARLLVGDRFGMKQPKWLHRIVVSEVDQPGYWEQRGWDDDAFVKTMSRIDFPTDQAAVPAGAPLSIYGVAYAGDRGIGRVEVTTGGESGPWQVAELEDASQSPLGPLTWVRWRVEMPSPAEGTVEVIVRAADGTGAVQDGRQTSPAPAGATGWHRVRLIAVALAGSGSGSADEQAPATLRP
jgi:DMSO/TMAO reductase YedYZ molybdopterin-dependent catalytic subunit